MFDIKIGTVYMDEYCRRDIEIDNAHHYVLSIVAEFAGAEEYRGYQGRQKK